MFKRLLVSAAVLVSALNVYALPPSSYSPEDAASSVIRVFGGFLLGVVSGGDIWFILLGLLIVGLPFAFLALLVFFGGLSLLGRWIH